MDFYLTKAAWGLLAPANALLWMLVGGLVLSLRPRRRRLGLGLVWTAAAVFTALALLPVGAWLGHPLEDRFPRPAVLPERVGGIIVLGGAVEPPIAASRGDPALNGAAERLLSFVELARRYPDAPLIATGGAGLVWDSGQKEGDVVVAVLKQMGFDTGRVMVENLSRNTWENALFSRPLADPQPGAPWILITSAVHMPRSVGIFRRQDWPVIPYPVDFRTRADGVWYPSFDLLSGLNLTSDMMREWLGLAGYFLMGRTDRLFPGP
ncbi:uncharacterized SAM-binding protein YcdF (DUF218 family) [Azospirillum fermentarium]|uniref:YdcF family protein n=1 Tax=Azospirillum fermentarium TaxID=1233114 RepID=UPI002226BC95|nr:YdcF family protein [Azospirillum fermentarium]MCW2246684.1 uncharacterized SAM-binding protein YcdF (DUF218 family) [Azospirillum fermentarium]